MGERGAERLAWGVAVVALVGAATALWQMGDAEPAPTPDAPRVPEAPPAPDQPEPEVEKDPLATRLVVRVETSAGAPVPGALVELRPTGDRSQRVFRNWEDLASPSIDVRCDTDGNVAVGGLLAGRWVVAASASGLSRSWAVADLDAVPECALTLRLVTGHRLAGRICDQDGRPITGARVFAGRFGDGLSARTEVATGPVAEAQAYGMFALDALSAGDHALWVSLPGHDPQLARIVRVPGVTSVPVEVAVGGPLKGVVHDAGTRHLVANARVRVEYMTETFYGRDFGETETDDRGCYRLPRTLPLRITAVTVAKDGYAEASFHPDDDSPNDMRWVHGLALGREATLDFAMMADDAPTDPTGDEVWAPEDAEGAPLTVPGTVRSSTGGALVDATVQVRHSEHGISSAHAWSGARRHPVAADGTFSVESLVAEHDSVVQVRVTAAGHAASVSAPVPLDDVGADLAFDVTLTPGRSLRGVVTDAETGRAVGRARIEIDDNELRSFGSHTAHVPWITAGVTDAAGRYELRFIENGIDRVRVVARGYVEERREWGDEDVRDVVLRPAHEVRGVVRFSDGRPARFVELSLDQVAEPGAADDVDLWRAWGTTRSDGSFRVRGLPRGRYVVEVSHDMTGPDFADHTTEAITAGDHDVELVVPLGVTIAGRVVDEWGAGVEGVIVEATSALSQYDTKWATTDADGRFSVPARKGESYRVTAERNGLVSPEPVDVQGGKQDLVLSVEAPPAERGLAGLLVDDEGEPLADVRIEARDAEDHRRVTGYDTTDADGRFAIEGLPDGAFRLELNDYDPRGLSLVHGLFDRGARGLRITARKQVEIAGVVVDADGQPVRHADVTISHALMGASYGCATDADGAFSLPGFAPRGGYVIAVEHATFVDRRVAGVEAGADPLRIVLSRGVELQGRIVGVDGRPVRRASFSLRLVDSDELFEVDARTDDDGAFHARGLRPGTYGVWVVEHGPAGPEEGVVAGRTGVLLSLRP